MKNQYINNIKCICKGNNDNCVCNNRECTKCEKCEMLIQNQFDSFMRKYYRKKGEEKEITHTSMGQIKGSWNISSEVYPEFLRLYKRFSRKRISAYVERSPYIAPFYFDVDFHTEKQVRYYKQTFVKKTIKKIIKIIEQNFDIPELSNTLHAYLFEKFEPTKHNDGGFKDGFHIMFPELILTVESRYYIYDKFMEELERDNFVKTEKIPYTNELNEIFDKSVIIDNGVLMYGAAKDNREPYKLTKVFDENCEQILPEINDSENEISESSYRSEKSNYDNDNDEIMEWDDIIEITSMRLYENREDMIIKPATKGIDKLIMENYDEKHSKDKKKKNVNKNKNNDDENDDEYTDITKNKSRKKDGVNEIDIRLAELLVKEVLSEKRAAEYESWRNVGWALHNVDDSLIETFHEFSKRGEVGKKKYKEGGRNACDKLWKEAKDEGYSIRSIRMWAREDNEPEYFRVLSDVYEETLQKTSSGTHYDIAEFVSTIYKDLYVCVDLKNKTWYEYYDHKWHKVIGGGSLYINLSKQIPVYLTEIINTQQRYLAVKEYTKIDENTRKELEVKRSVVDNHRKLINNLKTGSYKSSIMTELQHIMLDTTFEEKLNSNPYLLGFENGVYCLKPDNKGKPYGFRSGIPEDYISLSTGYNYIKKPNLKLLNDIKNFYKSCLPNINVCNYILTYIASALVGNTIQKFPFWIGPGGNGKSIALDMSKYSFGGYYHPLSVSYLTTKRSDSNAANPELAVLIGKRLVGIQESEKGEKLYLSKLKELSGGDSMSIRRLYEQPIEFKPQAKFILATNKLPEIDQLDGGVTRRIRCVEWGMKFVSEEDYDPTNPRHAIRDNELAQKIQTIEWRQNFMWLLINEIYPKYISEGLKEPKEVMERSGKYFANNDKIGSFLRICTEKCQDTEKHDLSHIYEELRNFYKGRYGNAKLPTLDDLIQYLENNDIKIDDNNKNIVYVYGIKQKKDDDEINILDELEA